jgi:hypothetical protein
VESTPTLASLAFGIYRTILVSLDTKIPLISGNTFDFIKDGYTGEHVDVYKPYGKKVHTYDVNSLYSSEMKNYPMATHPTGNPVYFEGDILSSSIKPFGIFEVEVPTDLNVPILQIKYKTEKGEIRTISPLGRWSGVFFSEEIFNAMKYGYKFEVIKGYLFNKDFIFLH